MMIVIGMFCTVGKKKSKIKNLGRIMFLPIPMCPLDPGPVFALLMVGTVLLTV